MIICEKCGNPIVPYGKYDERDIAVHSMLKYRMKLCVSCAVKMKQKEGGGNC